MSDNGCFKMSMGGVITALKNKHEENDKKDSGGSAVHCVTTASIAMVTRA